MQVKNSFYCCFINFLATLPLFLQYGFWPEVLKATYGLWLNESFISINFSLWWGIFCKAVHFSARTPHSLQLCATDFYSCRFLHIVTELCWPVRMKSLCVSGRELSSRPEFSWEMSLSQSFVLWPSLFFLCCGKNLRNVNQKSHLQCKNILVIVSVLEITAIYLVQNLLICLLVQAVFYYGYFIIWNRVRKWVQIISVVAALVCIHSQVFEGSGE